MQKKFISPTKISSNSPLSTKIPRGVHNKLLEAVIKDGYGMRGKSRWIIEALYDFLSLPDFPHFVEIANEIDDMNEALTVRIPEELATAINEAIICVRKEYPAMEGVKSHILRASIMQRLIRSETNHAPMVGNVLRA